MGFLWWLAALVFFVVVSEVWGFDFVLSLVLILAVLCFSFVVLFGMIYFAEFSVLGLFSGISGFNFGFWT